MSSGLLLFCLFVSAGALGTCLFTFRAGGEGIHSGRGLIEVLVYWATGEHSLLSFTVRRRKLRLSAASDRIRVRLSHSCHLLLGLFWWKLFLFGAHASTTPQTCGRGPFRREGGKKAAARATALSPGGSCFPGGQVRQDPDGVVGGHHKQIGKLMSLFASSEFSSPATGAKFPLLSIPAAESRAQAS